MFTALNANAYKMNFYYCNSVSIFIAIPPSKKISNKKYVPPNLQFGQNGNKTEIPLIWHLLR